MCRWDKECVRVCVGLLGILSSNLSICAVGGCYGLDCGTMLKTSELKEQTNHIYILLQLLHFYRTVN